MSLKILIVLALVLGGCSAFNPSPERFREFTEHQLAGPGSYSIPQWSPDSRYLAFIHSAHFTNLVVHDSQNNSQWIIASDVFSGHFSWKSDGAITFLKYSPQHFVYPYPRLLDLYQADIHSRNTKLIASSLLGVGDYAWTNEGDLFILLTDRTSVTHSKDIYLGHASTGDITLLLTAAQLGLEDISMLALSPEEDAILIFGINMELAPVNDYIVIIDLETQTTLQRFSPSQIISPRPDDPALLPAMSHGTNFSWVAGDQWFLAAVNAPTGLCYNYALFFFNLIDLQESFCIPTVSGIAGDPVISPDLSKISYITVADPGRTYIMVADIPSDLRERLQSSHE